MTAAPTAGGEKQNLWANLLKSASTSTSVPTSQLLILGGTPAQQSAFLDSIAPPNPQQPAYSSRRRQVQRAPPRPIPTSSSIGLGFTYRDLYSLPTQSPSNKSGLASQSTNQDDEDFLSRLSVHLLHDPDPAFAPLIAPLFSSTSNLESTATVLILDWAKPWTFLATIESALRTLRTAVGKAREASCDVELALEANDRRWLDWRNRPSASSMVDATQYQALSSTATLPLGPGEFDTPLGIPLLIVGVDAHKMEEHETRLGWKEEDFDFVLQFVRTIALKSGAGLVYTLPGGDGAGGIPAESRLLRGMLGIEGSGWESVRHNVVDREGTIVPPGWDSWGKIRVLRDGFDVEGVSAAWTNDLERTDLPGVQSTEPTAVPATTARGIFEARIRDPRPPTTKQTVMEVELVPDQVFLAQQMERLEGFKTEEERAKIAEEKRRKEVDENGSATTTTTTGSGRTTATEAHEGMASSVKDQIGPVQFNMGGIQYDADEALRRLKERNKSSTSAAARTGASATAATSTPERRTRTSRESTPFTPGSPPQFEAGGKDIPVENLEAYFASLMKGRGGASAANSPRYNNSPRTTTVAQNQGPGSGGGGGGGGGDGGDTK